MTELRFVERVTEEGDRKGTLERILQYRDAPYAPWRDVPLVKENVAQTAAEELQEHAS